MAGGTARGVVLKVFTTGGSTKKGKPWTKHEVVLRHTGAAPTVGIYSFFEGPYKSMPSIVANDEIELDFTIEAKEFKGRWYNNIMIHEVRILVSADVGDVIKDKTTESTELPF